MPEHPSIKGIYLAACDLQTQIEANTFIPPEVIVQFLEGMNKLYAEIVILDRQLVQINDTNK